MSVRSRCTGITSTSAGRLARRLHATRLASSSRRPVMRYAVFGGCLESDLVLPSLPAVTEGAAWTWRLRVPDAARPMPARHRAAGGGVERPAQHCASRGRPTSTGSADTDTGVRTTSPTDGRTIDLAPSRGRRRRRCAARRARDSPAARDATARPSSALHGSAVAVEGGADRVPRASQGTASRRSR